MKKPWNIGNGWTRKTSGRRVYYFHKGKRTTETKFSSALKRQHQRRKKLREDDTKKLRKALKLPPLKKQKGRTDFDFCKIKDREKFYDQILKDKQEFRRKHGEEFADNIRVDILIGDGKLKRRKDNRKEWYQQGYRRFKTLAKLRIFLGIGKITSSDGREMPEWTKSKNGLCQFEKTAFLVKPRFRGDREIEKRVLRKYKYDPRTGE